MSFAIGLKSVRGHTVVKRAVKKATKTPSKSRKFAKEIIHEVCGFAPYERRLIELVRNGMEKKSLKFAKKKVLFFVFLIVLLNLSFENVL